MSQFGDIKDIVQYPKQVRDHRSSQSMLVNSSGPKRRRGGGGKGKQVSSVFIFVVIIRLLRFVNSGRSCDQVLSSKQNARVGDGSAPSQKADGRSCGDQQSQEEERDDVTNVIKEVKKRGSRHDVIVDKILSLAMTSTPIPDLGS